MESRAIPSRPGGQNHTGFQPALQICDPHGGANHKRVGDEKGSGAAFLLLPLLPGACGSKKELKAWLFAAFQRGEFHFPNVSAAEIAVNTVKEFLKKQTSVKKVIFNVFKDTDKEIYSKLLGANIKS